VKATTIAHVSDKDMQTLSPRFRRMNLSDGKDRAPPDLAMLFDSHNPPLLRQSKETNLVGLLLGFGSELDTFLSKLIEDRIHQHHRRCPPASLLTQIVEFSCSLSESPHAKALRLAGRSKRRTSFAVFLQRRHLVIDCP
jgi:hypothetical protein